MYWYIVNNKHNRRRIKGTIEKQDFVRADTKRTGNIE